MHILSVHNHYQIRGGEEESHEAEVSLLRDKGNQVDLYEENNDRIPALGQIKLAARTVWSKETYQVLKSRFTQQTYDVVHVHNFLPLISPSVYYAAKANGIPVVQTLQNYRLLCPKALFFRQGRVCEDCIEQLIPLPGVVHACYRDSRAATATVATMLTLHRAIGTWTNQVDVYIALTEFARQKFIQGGLPAQKIVVKPHFVYPDPGLGEGRGNYALFVGRLSPEKGLDTVLRAWEKLGNKISLKIVGDGPLAAQVAEASTRLPGVEWLGRQPLSQVCNLLGEAKFLVFPSSWYETFGRVAIEAFAKGTPVIAANIGAIAELVEHSRTGLKFCPQDSEDLTTQVEWALSHPAKLDQMRQEARAEFDAKYTATENYRRLMEIYEQVIVS